MISQQWIDAGGNPAVRHEGGMPSNNLIKDVPHRATVFVWADPEVIAGKESSAKDIWSVNYTGSFLFADCTNLYF